MSVLENIKKQLNVSNLYLILFFLYSLRIFGIQDEILWVWAVIGILYFVVRQKKLLLGFQGVILCVITPVYALVYKYYFTEIRGYTWKDAIYMIFLPVFMYILSRQFAYKKKEKMLELGLWCIAAGTFVLQLVKSLDVSEIWVPVGGAVYRWNFGAATPFMPRNPAFGLSLSQPWQDMESAVCCAGNGEEESLRGQASSLEILLMCR